MFTYYNANPNGLHKSDCVKRAITVATGMDYYAVERGVVKYKAISGADRYNDVENAIGYIYTLGAKRVMLKRGVKTVGDFAKAYPDGSYIVDTPKHWTAVVDGVIYDTWDCSQELIDEGAFLMERQRVMDTLPPEPIGMDGLSEFFASIDSFHLYLKSNFFTRLRRAKYALSEIYGEFREKNEIRNRILELLKYE